MHWKINNIFFFTGKYFDKGLLKIKENFVHDIKDKLLRGMNCFAVNSFKANPGKFRFAIVVEKKWQTLNNNSLEIKEKEDLMLLDVTIDNELNLIIN